MVVAADEAAILMAPFVLDTAFVIATSMKIVEGAWLPVALGAFVVLVMGLGDAG
jgi:K+ transporter